MIGVRYHRNGQSAMELRAFAPTLLLPPGLFVFVLLIGLLLTLYRRLLGWWVMLIGTLSLYALSLPMAPVILAKRLQRYPALTNQIIARNKPQAIVVVSAGRYFRAPEYGPGDTISAITLIRVRYAAYIYRRTHLPILVSGGSQAYNTVPDADLMTQTLQQEFSTPVKWLETQSANTWQNAKYSTRLLKRAGIKRILLVTSAIHMPRAMLAFQHFGLKITPAPTHFLFKPRLARYSDEWLPNRYALFSSSQCLYEYLGLLWYHYKH